MFSNPYFLKNMSAADVAVGAPFMVAYNKFIDVCKNARLMSLALRNNFRVFSGCQGIGKSSLLKHLLEVCASKDDANHSEGIWGDFHPFLYKKGSTKIPDRTNVVFCELDDRPNGKEFDDFKAYLKRYPITLFIVMGCTDRFYTPQKNLSKAGALFTDLKVGEGQVLFSELCKFDETHVFGLVQRIVPRFSSESDHVLSKAQKKSGSTPERFAYEVVADYLKQKGNAVLLSPELSVTLREQLRSDKSYGGIGWPCLGKAFKSSSFTLYPFPKNLEICGRKFADLKTPGGGCELVRHYLQSSESIPPKSTPVFWGIEATSEEQGEFVKSVASALPRSFEPKCILMTKEALVGCFPDGTITPNQVDKKSVGALIHATHLFGAKPPASFPEKITFTGILVSETTGHIVAVAEGQHQSDGKTLLHISVAEGDTPFEV
jgi:hypothetical protein